jgi:hypothetical protein
MFFVKFLNIALTINLTTTLISIVDHHFFFQDNTYRYSRSSEFIRRCRAVPYRTIPFSTRDRTATVLFCPFSVIQIARTLPRFKYYRFTVLTLVFGLSANRTVPKHWSFFVILALKNLFLC